jgi:hypothetical protein
MKFGLKLIHTGVSVRLGSLASMDSDAWIQQCGLTISVTGAKSTDNGLIGKNVRYTL